MDCEDAEEARDLLRHRNSNVTRAVYRAHFGDERRELLRSRMAATDRKEPRQGRADSDNVADARGGEVLPLRQISNGRQ